MKPTHFSPPALRSLGMIGLALATGTALIAASPQRVRSATARSFMSHFAVTPMASDGLRQSEQTFLEGAAERSRAELRLAELALTQASNSEVRALALQLSGDQRTLRDSIEALMRKNGMGVPTGEGDAPESYQRLIGLSGAAFDREVVNLLAKLHEELVSLFEQAASDAKDAEVRALAAGQLPMVRGHRQQILELKKNYE